LFVFFFFQAEDGIRDLIVTGVQTCALPISARKFIDRYQDRVLFGTDATPNAPAFPQQLFGDHLYEIYFRFLETEDEYFAYAPARSEERRVGKECRSRW